MAYVNKYDFKCGNLVLNLPMNGKSLGSLGIALAKSETSCSKATKQFCVEIDHSLKMCEIRL